MRTVPSETSGRPDTEVQTLQTSLSSSRHRQTTPLSSDYLVPDSMRLRLQHGAMDEYIPLQATITQWQIDSENVPSFCKPMSPQAANANSETKQIRIFLREIHFEALFRMLAAVRDSADSPDRIVDDELLNYDHPVTIRDLIRQLDTPWIQWLKGEISEAQLRNIYHLAINSEPRGVDEELLPIELGPIKKVRCPFWLLALAGVLLLVTCVLGFFAVYCTRHNCFAAFRQKFEAFPFTTIELPLDEAESYAMKQSGEFIFLRAKNGSETTEFTIGSNPLVGLFIVNKTVANAEEKEVIENDCELAGSISVSNCFLRHAFGSQPIKFSGLFYGNKAKIGGNPLFLLKCDKSCKDTVLTNHHFVMRFKDSVDQLIPVGDLEPFMSKMKGYTLVDALFLNNGSRTLWRKQKHYEICGLEVKDGRYEMYDKQCFVIGEIPCASSECDVRMLQISAMRRIFVAIPSDRKEIKVTFHSEEDKFSRLQAFVPYPDFEPPAVSVITRFAHDTFRVCYIKAFVLKCRLYDTTQLRA